MVQAIVQQSRQHPVLFWAVVALAGFIILVVGLITPLWIIATKDSATVSSADLASPQRTQQVQQSQAAANKELSSPNTEQAAVTTAAEQVTSVVTESTTGAVSSTAQITALPTEEQLKEMGVLSKGIDYDVDWIPRTFGMYENGGLDDFEGSGIAKEVAGTTLDLLFFISQYRVFDYNLARVWSTQSADNARKIASLLYKDYGIDPTPVRRKIYSIHVAPERGLGVTTRTIDRNRSTLEYIKRDYFLFSSIISITFDGEQGKETIRFRIQMSRPGGGLSDPEFQILN